MVYLPLIHTHIVLVQFSIGFRETKKVLQVTAILGIIYSSYDNVLVLDISSLYFSLVTLNRKL